MLHTKLVPLSTLLTRPNTAYIQLCIHHPRLHTQPSTHIAAEPPRMELPPPQLDQLSGVAPAVNFPNGSTEARLSAILESKGVKNYKLKRVAFEFQKWSLESRRDVLGAHSVDHLCKSIVLVNTQAPSNVVDCSDRNNSRYYVLVVQHTARFNAKTINNFFYSLNDGKMTKKKFNFRLAPEDITTKLTGYERNAVTCIGMKMEIPVIIDEAIIKLEPDFFWFGGGEVDLKLGIRTSEFVDCTKPFIFSCSGT